MSDRKEFQPARDAFKAIHQAQRLENATYTAVEVKALTKTAADLAYALGRKEAAEEIAEAFEPTLYQSDDGTEFEHTHPEYEGEPECPACWVQHIRQILGIGLPPKAERPAEGHMPIGIRSTDVGPFIRCSCGSNPSPHYWLAAHWPGDKAEGERLADEMFAREIGTKENS